MSKKISSFNQLFRHVRPKNLKVQFDTLEFSTNRASKMSKHYDYFATKEGISRVNIGGKCEVALKSKHNHLKFYYIMQLEKLIEAGIEDKYKTLENFYAKNGYGEIMICHNETLKEHFGDWYLSTFAYEEPQILKRSKQ